MIKKNISYIIITWWSKALTLLYFMTSCHQVEEKTLSNNLYDTDEGIKLELIAESTMQWNSLAVIEDRIFVAFPRWEDGVSISLGEIVDHTIRPYPNKKMNQFQTKYDKENPFFISVQALFTNNHILWVLDAANPLKKGEGYKGPVIYKIDTETDEVLQKLYFREASYTKNSSFSNLVICNNNNYAYIADSGEGAIIVKNLRTGEERVRLISHHSTKAETNVLFINNNRWVQRVHVHSLTLDSTGHFLYYMPISGYHLYSIPTAALINPDIPESDLERFVRRIAFVGASSRKILHDINTLLFCNIEESGIGRLIGEEEFSILFRHNDIAWPADITRKGDDYYFITSQKHLDKEKRSSHKLFKMRILEDSYE